MPVYFGNGKNFCCCNNCVWLDNGKAQHFVGCKVNVLYCDCSSDDELFLEKNWACMVCLVSHVSAIDCGISHTIQNASKLSMSKVLEQGKTEMKRNSIDLWKKNKFFSSQVCDFFFGKDKLAWEYHFLYKSRLFNLQG